MFDLILIGLLVYNNVVRAKRKDQQPIVWGLLTFGAYIFTMLIGFFVVVVNFCKDTIDLSTFATLDASAKAAAQDRLLRVFETNPLHMATVELFGVGGYLIIRYILEKKPDKKEAEVHWMDKIGKE